MKRAQKLTPYGIKVRKRMLELGMSQQELSSIIGCWRPYLHEILTGRRSGKKYIESINEALKISGKEA